MITSFKGQVAVMYIGKEQIKKHGEITIVYKNNTVKQYSRVFYTWDSYTEEIQRIIENGELLASWYMSDNYLFLND